MASTRSGGSGGVLPHGASRFAAAVTDRLPPPTYFVVSAIFHYLGPAFAVLLFSRVDVLGVAWLRIASAAVVFAVWRRPWRVWRRLDRGTRIALLAWGWVLALMNSAFYLAIDRLPLGTVAAIEFLPVIALAAVSVRTRRNLLALLLAASGVYLLSDLRFEGEPVGLLFAVLNAVLFSGYIVLGHRVAQSEQINGIDGLGLSMIIAAVVALPIGITGAAPAFADPIALSAGIGVGNLLLRHPLRRRSTRDVEAAAQQLRADGLAAAGDRHDHRSGGARSDPDDRRDHWCGAGDPRPHHPPGAPHETASRHPGLT